MHCRGVWCTCTAFSTPPARNSASQPTSCHRPLPRTLEVPLALRWLQRQGPKGKFQELFGVLFPRSLIPFHPFLSRAGHSQCRAFEATPCCSTCHTLLPLSGYSTACRYHASFLFMPMVSPLAYCEHECVKIASRLWSCCPFSGPLHRTRSAGS